MGYLRRAHLHDASFVNLINCDFIAADTRSCEKFFVDAPVRLDYVHQEPQALIDEIQPVRNFPVFLLFRPLGVRNGMWNLSKPVKSRSFVGGTQSAKLLQKCLHDQKVPERNAKHRIYKTKNNTQGLEAVDVMKIVANMTAPIREKTKKARANVPFGHRPAFPIHPGTKMECDVPVYANPVVLEEVWENAQEATDAYRNYSKALSSDRFGQVKSQQELEGLRSRGFLGLNLHRDDHLLAAHCHLTYQQNTLPFPVLVEMCDEYKATAMKTNPATFTPYNIKHLMTVINMDCKIKIAPIPEFSERVETEALRLLRMQPFMRTDGMCNRAINDDDLNKTRVERCKHYAKLLVDRTPHTFSVRANTIAKIALLFTAAKEGLGPAALCEEDRPFISRKMKKIVNEIKKVELAGVKKKGKSKAVKKRAPTTHKKKSHIKQDKDI